MATMVQVYVRGMVYDDGDGWCDGRVPGATTDDVRDGDDGWVSTTMVRDEWGMGDDGMGGMVSMVRCRDVDVRVCMGCDDGDGRCAGDDDDDDDDRADDDDACDVAMTAGVATMGDDDG